MMKKVKIALVQMKMGKDPAKNLDKAILYIGKAAKNKAKVICLPELFTTEYFPQRENKTNFKFAESIPGPTTKALAQVAKRLKVVIVAPLFEKRAQGLYHNTVAVLGPKGEIVGKYRKMHIPDDPSFYEKYYFAPGDLGYRTFDTPYGKLGLLICWDQWYPEAARLTALKGAQILIYPTAIGWHKTEPKPTRVLQRKAWQHIQISHAISNGVFVASINRTGVEKNLSFWGSSFVAAPDGEVLHEAPVNTEKIIYAECDFKKIERIRQEWPFLRDRRIDSYKPLTSRYIEST